MAIQNGKLLYHLTCLENFESIIDKGLLPRNMTNNFRDIADQEIIDFRQANGLNSLVPFHFFAKNPFDGRVQIDNPDQNFIYICVNRNYARKNNFHIITMHPIALNDNLILHDYDNGFNLIDWETMEQREYQDDYCKNVCMAESLSPDPIDPSDFFCIYVKDSATEKIVKDVTLSYYEGLPFYINVMPNMFLE